MENWISVYDRLPKKFQKVKVMGFDENTKVIEFESESMLVKDNRNEHRFACEHHNTFITHWMPL
jgi:hypothetical protein